MKPNYKNACVYKLCCKDIKIKDVYVGSTCNFRVRKYGHKSSCNNENNKKNNLYVYRFIRENGGWDNWVMIEIEKVVCKDKRELEKVERYWFENLNATLNIKRPYIDIKKYQKELSQSKKRREYSKKYNNSKDTKERMHNYYLDNKEKLLSNRNQTITCVCGTEIKKGRTARHMKTKKHRNLISKIKKPLHDELLNLI